jgi:hypothetical protein
MPSSTLADREVDVVHAPEGGVVQRVQADRHPLEPGGAQRACLLRQQRAVGGQRQVDRRRQRRRASMLDQPFDVLAQQRFAARQRILFTPRRDEHPRERCDLLETQQFARGRNG